MVFNKLVSALAFGLPAAQAAIPSIAGFTLTWSDDFVGSPNSLPNTGNWILDVGTSYPGGPANWGTGEIQTYTSSTNNIRLDGNGALQITAIKDGAGAWTSARIETQRGDFMAQAGGKMRIQASINVPDVGENSIGYWPAFWALGNAYRGNYWNWPGIGELDILETVNGQDRVWGTMHCGVTPGGPCKETDGLSGNRQCPNSPCPGNFHTYTLEVDRTQELEAVRWFVDDVLYWQVVESDLPNDVWVQAIHSPQYILLNLAIGGAMPNNKYGSSTPLANTVSGGTLQVEYVAVYNA
ncbi:family 16 glycosyl hydrolase [Colletotrichum zoysiae]|uniref:Family 16 glycosyl hydrolase n=1 Tax=Colletotrichum zoysiae TaxID=1216348 RepID=A0AAD9HCJ1_9PEZI|nr:family 16 glycosyl hydrolase [Colletotrichum zoysiae]